MEGDVGVGGWVGGEGVEGAYESERGYEGYL